MINNLIARLFPVVMLLVGLYLWKFFINGFYVPVAKKKNLDESSRLFVCWILKWLGYFAIFIYFLIGF